MHQAPCVRTSDNGFMGASYANARVASWLREAADLLAAQGASPYRVHAYRAAAQGVETYPRDVRAVFEHEGTKGLDAIPRVGLGIAAAIADMLVMNRWPMLERLRGTVPAPLLLQSVPGIGPALAGRLHETLHVDRLEDLERVANDGRLASLPRVGRRRAAAIGAAVERMLGRLRPPPAAALLPPVASILDVDREYREGAAAGTLRRIAPKRNNPAGDAWLPVLHAVRGPWHFTALFSNTPLAHRLGHTHDWVVVYAYDGDHVERQCTVVTERSGPLAGRRVVRGREAECLDLFQPEQEEVHAAASHAA